MNALVGMIADTSAAIPCLRELKVHSAGCFEKTEVNLQSRDDAPMQMLGDRSKATSC